MRINCLYLFLVCNLFFSESFSQNSPKVPQKIRVDNMVLNISDDVIPIIQNEVDAIHLNKKYFQIFVDRINIYFPIIEKILEEEEMPDDLKYLALQESALISDAVSSSNAVGFWQFKKETAEDYGLTVDDKVDERKNIISSTRAASKYIKNSNYLFENWIFSIFSYYQGLSGAKALVDPQLYGSKRMIIDKNTHWYIIKFLGYKIAFEDFIVKSNYNRNFTVYENETFNSLKDLSSSLSIDEKELISINSWISSDRIPSDKVFSFLIPDSRENVFKRSSSIKKSYSINSETKENFFSPIDIKISEVIQKKKILLNGLPAFIADSSDNINDIIKLYRVSKKSFLVFNDIKGNHQLTPGAPYYLTKKRKKGRVQVYVRREDQSLWEISQLFGVRLSSLEKMNKENASSKIILRRRSIL